MCKVTYYCGCDICSEGLVNFQGKPIGSTGEVLKANYSIAVDPSVIPLGSDVLIGDKVYKTVKENALTFTWEALHPRTN